MCPYSFLFFFVLHRLKYNKGKHFIIVWTQQNWTDVKIFPIFSRKHKELGENEAFQCVLRWGLADERILCSFQTHSVLTQQIKRFSAQCLALTERKHEQVMSILWAFVVFQFELVSKWSCSWCIIPVFFLYRWCHFNHIKACLRKSK